MKRGRKPKPDCPHASPACDECERRRGHYHLIRERQSARFAALLSKVPDPEKTSR
jgi:hypothetical protein